MKEEHGIELTIGATQARIGAAQYAQATKIVITSAGEATVAIQGTNTAIAATPAATKTAVGGLAALRTGYTKLLAVAYGVYKFVRVSADFEESMSELAGVATTTAKTAEEAIQWTERLEKTARNLGATTRFTATEAAQGLLELARAGYDVDRSIAAANTVLNLAEATHMDLARSATIVTDVMSQFGLSANEAERAADAVVAAANRSKTDVPQMAEAFAQAGTIAGSLGISVEETAAALGVLADRALKGSMGGTQLRGIFASLLSPTDKAERALKRLGLSLEDVNPQKHGIIGAFSALHDVQMDAIDAVDIFGRRQVAGAIALSDLSARLRELTGEIQDADGETQRLAERQRRTFYGRLAELGSAFQELFISVWDTGLGYLLTESVRTIAIVVRQVTEGINTIVGAIRGVPEELLKWQNAWARVSYFADIAASEVERVIDHLIAYIGAGIEKAIELTGAGVVAALDVAIKKPIETLQNNKLLSWLTGIYGLGADILGDKVIAATEELQGSISKATASTHDLNAELEAANERHNQRQIDAAAQYAQKLLDIADAMDKTGGKPGAAAPGEKRGGGIADALGEEPEPGALDLDAQMRQQAEMGLRDYIDRIRLERDTMLMGNEAREKFIHLYEVERMAREAGIDLTEEQTLKLKKQIDTLQTLRKIRELADDMGDAFGQATVDIIQDIENIQQAAENMLRSLQRIILEHLVARPIATGVGNLLAGLGGAVVGAGGAAIGAPGSSGIGPLPAGWAVGGRGMIFGDGMVQAMGRGDVYNTPTFIQSGRQRGIIGEGGIEAAMPLARTSDGRLGVLVANGGSSRPVVVNQYISTPDAGSFRRSQRQIYRRAYSALGKARM